MATGQAARRSIALALILVFAGCATQPPEPEVVVEKVRIECSPPLPGWVFELFDAPGMALVRELGGTNGALYVVFGLQTFMLESANIRLQKIQELQAQNRDPRCDENDETN